MIKSIINFIYFNKSFDKKLEQAYKTLEQNNEIEKIYEIKEKLQSNLTTAPLFDTPLFTKNIESAYTQMYERHHAGLKPDHIYVEK